MLALLHHLQTSYSRSSLLASEELVMGISNTQPVNNYVFVLVLCLAVIGAFLHGTAMAMKKVYGNGHQEYWRQSRWWVGVGCDAVAGALIWPAMPFVPVQILAPLIIVVQLVTSAVLGLLIFCEKNSQQKTMGLLAATVGVVGISLATPHNASHIPLDTFWSDWSSHRVLFADLIASTAIICSHALGHRSTCFGIISGSLEGLQYICSRTLVNALIEYQLAAFTHPAVLGAICIKVSCIVFITYFQQIGLEANFSHFAGIFLVACTVFTCIYGTAFFAEELDISISFLSSASMTLAGIWLLNQSMVETGSDTDCGKLSKLSGESHQTGDDSVFEGEIRASDP